MKRKFISVSTKLMVLIIGSLLIISIAFSTLSLMRIQNEFTHFQREALKKGEEHWQVHSHLLSAQLRTWLESFGDIVLKDENKGFSDLQKALERQYDILQLYLNVENVWLVDEHQQLIFNTSKLPKTIKQRISDVLNRQISVSEVFCQNSCQQLVIVPLINQQGNVAILAISASLVDTLYSMKKTLKSDVAIISRSKNTHQVSVLSTSNAELMQTLTSKNKIINLDNFKDKGRQFYYNNKHYLANLLPLSTTQMTDYYLMIINDVTRFKDEKDLYRKQVLISIAIIFIVLAFLIYFITFPFAKRLLNLAEALPLLAQRKFSQFRQVNMKRRRFFPDELDVLGNAAKSLSYQLEQLNIEVEQKTKELENIAMYDLLTGLANRNMLNYQLKKALPNIERNNNSIAVLFLDLDDFKKVNDSHGHDYGDKLLIEAAERIRLSVRKVDMVCRFGGDEFVVFLDQLASANEAKVVASKILKNFKAPIKIDNNLFYISTSIGIAYTEDATEKVDNLIRQADIAMYEAKNEGGSNYFVYQNEMYLKVAQQVMLESEVRQALAKNQFSLSLQPQIFSQDNKLAGFEALLRWHHPERGMISPEDFIPILEKSTYMIELGYWVIRRCFELVVKMKAAGLDHFSVAINLTAAQFVDPQLIIYLKELLAEFNVSANHFELELTEQTLVKDVNVTIEVMSELKVLGFSFAIDDFGTGYSSLAYLKRMPVDVIKIDKSFVFGMLDNYADYQIIKSTIAMVKNLGLIVVAEGVETSAQLRELSELECNIIQGYLFSKPVPEAELFEFIEQQFEKGYWKTQVESFFINS